MTIELLTSTPLHIAAQAIRCCWASEDKSDTSYAYSETALNHRGEAFLGPKDKELIFHVGNKNKHSSVLRHLNMTFRVSGMTTKTLLAATRHKAGVDWSVQSTRYTTSKRADQLAFTQTDDERIDTKLATIHNLVQEAISEGISDDKIAMLLPQAYQYTAVVTMNVQALQHFLVLRTAPSAHADIQQLANELYNNAPENYKYLLIDSIYKNT